MKKLYFSIVLINVLILVTCNKKTDQTKIEINDGVEIVHNSEVPLHPELTVTFKEELTISEKNEADEIILFRPQIFIVDSQDNIYISDFSDKSIKVFDQHGNYQGTIGRVGQGPGEFQHVSALSFLPGGRCLVLDHRNRRTSLFDKSSQFVQSYQWLTNQYRVFFVTDSTYCTEERSTPIGEETILLKIYDFSGNEITNFGKFETYPHKPVVIGNTRSYFYLPYIPRAVFAVDHENQKLYYCLSDKYLIEAYDGTGKLVKKIDKVHNLIPVSNKDVEEFRTANGQIKKDNESYQIRKKFQLPDVKAITERMLVDSEGNLWVALFETKNENGRKYNAYDIFNKDGIYFAKIWSDIRPELFVRNKMYRMETDEETGIRTVKRYRVIWED